MLDYRVWREFRGTNQWYKVYGIGYRVYGLRLDASASGARERVAFGFRRTAFGLVALRRRSKAECHSHSCATSLQPDVLNLTLYTLNLTPWRLRFGFHSANKMSFQILLSVFCIQSSVICSLFYRFRLGEPDFGLSRADALDIKAELGVFRSD